MWYRYSQMGGGKNALAQNNPLNPAFSVLPSPITPKTFNKAVGATGQAVGQSKDQVIDFVTQNKKILDYSKKVLKGFLPGIEEARVLNSITPEIQAELQIISEKIFKENIKYLHPFDEAKDLGTRIADKFDAKYLDKVSDKTKRLMTAEFKKEVESITKVAGEKYMKPAADKIAATIAKNPKLNQLLTFATRGGAKGLQILAGSLSSLLAAYQVYTIGVYLQKVFTTEGGVLGIPASETANMVASIVGIFFPAVGVASLIANAIGNSDFMQTSFKEIGTAIGAEASGVSTDQMREMLANEGLYGTSTYDDQTAVFNQIQKRFRELIKNKVSAPIARNIVKKEFAGQFAAAVKIYQAGVRNNMQPQIAYAKTFLPKFEELYSQIIKGDNFTPRKAIPQTLNPQYYGPSTGGVGYGGSNTRVI